MPSCVPICKDDYHVVELVLFQLLFFVLASFTKYSEQYASSSASVQWYLVHIFLTFTESIINYFSKTVSVKDTCFTI